MTPRRDGERKCLHPSKCNTSAPWWAAALAVAVAAGAEALPRPLNDNLRVPLTAALVLHLLG